MPSTRARALAAVPAAVLLALALAGPSSGAGKTVAVKDDFFTPKRLTVAKGTTVTYRWQGRSPHDVVGSGAQRFRSKIQTSGSYQVRYRAKGTVRVVCTIHPGMTQTVRVR